MGCARNLTNIFRLCTFLRFRGKGHQTTETSKGHLLESIYKYYVCMMFNPQRPFQSTHLTDSKPPTISLGGNALSWVNNFKYLGHVLDTKLGDSGDINRKKRSLYYSVNMLCALVRHASSDILMKLFRSYCMNFYGCELWNTANERKVFCQLCVAYHSCVKKLVRVPKSSRNQGCARLIFSG